MTLHLPISITAVEEAAESAPFVLRGQFEDSIRTAGRIGYDAIELHIADTSSLDCGSIEKHLDNSGIRLSSLGTGLAYARERLSLTSNDKNVRGRAVQRIKSHIRFAANFHSCVILGLIRGKISECLEDKFYFSWLEESLCDCLDEAENCGVPLMLEAVNRLEADSLTTTAETLQIIRKIGSAKLFLHLDSYHMDIGNESCKEAFALASGKLGHVHLADRNRLPPGAGGIDFAEIIQQLELIGYKGFLAVECRPFPNPSEAAEKIFEYLKRFLPDRNL